MAQFNPATPHPRNPARALVWSSWEESEEESYASDAHPLIGCGKLNERQHPIRLVSVGTANHGVPFVYCVRTVMELNLGASEKRELPNA